jgi:hypothetical protein
VQLGALEALNNSPNVHHLSASIRLKPLKDFSGVGAKPRSFISENQNLKQTGVVIGLIDSDIGAAQTTFPTNIHSVWDQMAQGNGWDSKKNYGNVIPGANLGAGAGSAQSGIAAVAAAFNNEFTAPQLNQIVLVKTDFQSARVADGVHYISHVAGQIGKPAVIILGLDGHLHALAETDDLSRFIELEKGANCIVPPGGINSNGTTHKTVRVETNPRVTDNTNTSLSKDLEISFFVPKRENGEKGLSQFILRGWYEAAGRCEIIIKSTDGGSTSSRRPGEIKSNETQYTKYDSSKAFLTVPVVSKVIGDYREFFIDVRPIDKNKAINGGTWNLLFKNYGTTPVNVTVLSWVPEGETELKFR